MTQHPVEARRVFSDQPFVGLPAPALQAVLLARHMGLEPTRAKHRRECQRDHQRHHDRRRQGDRELAKQTFDDPAHEQDRQEHRHQRHVHRQQCETDFLGTEVRGLHRRHTFVDVPGNVLQHHDGIVHHQPGGQNQRHQRQVVQREAIEVHHRESADQRHRHRQGRNQRRTEVTEKQEHHQNHQGHGDQQGHFRFVQCGLDHRRAVHGQVQFDAGRKHRLQRRQLGLDLVDRLDDVGAGLPVDDQQYRRIVVEEPAVVAVFDAVADLGHILQAQGCTVGVMNDQRFVVLGFFQLIVGLDLPQALAVLHRALGPAHVGIGDGVAHIVQRHAVLIERLGFEFDAHRRQRTAADLDLADPLHLGQALGQDGRSQVVELALFQHIRGQRQHHDRRLGRVDLLVGRHAAHTAGQQVTRGVDRRLHLTRRAVDVAVEVELQDHPCRALAGATAHGVDPGDGAEGTLKRRGHGGRHDLRAGTRQAGLHHDHRKVHLWQRRHRQQAEADTAQQHDRQAQQHGRDRTLDERTGKVHGCSTASTDSGLRPQRRPRRSKYR